MHSAQDYFPKCPEPFIVSLARSGDRGAFAELVRRRQSPVRHLMRSLCNDAALADDLAQQVFLQAWLKLRNLRKADAFGAWLKRLAVTAWLQHVRRKDALRGAGDLDGTERPATDAPEVGLDLGQALATLPDAVRLCIVLSYGEGMSHGEIAELTGLPLGTVKSHIKRGAERLRQELAVYDERPRAEETP